MGDKSLESIVGKRIKCQVIAEAFADTCKRLDAKYSRVYLDDVCYILGISKASAQKYAGILGVGFDSKMADRKKGKIVNHDLKRFKTSVYEIMAKKYAPQLKKAIKKGISSMQDLEQKLGLSESTILAVAEYSNIKLPKGKRGRKLGVFKRKPDVDCMIKRGFSLSQMAEKQGCTPQNINYYLGKSGLREQWKQLRLELNPHFGAKAKSRIASLIYGQMYSKAVKNEDRPYQRALEYRFGGPGRQIPLENLVKLFKEYYSAIDENKKVTYMGLARAAGMSYSNVTTVFDVLDLGHRQHLKQTKCDMTGERKRQIKKVLHVDISGPDAADLLGLPEYLVAAYLRRAGTPKKETKPLKQFFFSVGETDALTMRKARRIYEAKDAGFNLDEVCEYTGYKKEVVDYALQNRNEIQEKIISCWDYLTGEKHDKPYL